MALDRSFNDTEQGEHVLWNVTSRSLVDKHLCFKSYIRGAKIPGVRSPGRYIFAALFFLLVNGFSLSPFWRVEF
jgi:hypothetical protein